MAISETYDRDGVVYLKNFVNKAQYPLLINEISQLEVDTETDLRLQWNNRKVCFFSRNSTNEPVIDNDFVTEPYFLQSRNKAHVFYEQIDGRLAINRIGHGMHLMNKYRTIQEIIYHNHELSQLLRMAGLRRPICHLSVYIPKQSNELGSEVRPHQESTFAYTVPQTAVVLWIALDDATIENACMWGILGSNKWPLKTVSRVDYTLKRRIFNQLDKVHIPDFNTERDKFTPLEVQAGDALLFHGNFVHCSPKNTSQKSRKALSMQFIDTLNVDYPDTNWINPTNTKYLYSEGC